MSELTMSMFASKDDLIAALQRQIKHEADMLRQAEGELEAARQRIADLEARVTATEMASVGMVEELAKIAAIVGREGDWFEISDDVQGLQARLAAAERDAARLREALLDMRSGWKYIRETHGDLYGVGWDRAQDKADAALAAAGEKGE